MNIMVKKKELLKWITQIRDESTLRKVLEVKNYTKGENHLKRVHGCGKGTFVYVSSDFDEPLAEFHDYIP
ncbi:MAG: hypothetical protein QME52_05080 [Bacteroidota bacterium]|nr:hypothetical protein [Bacteroidota bacterium]